MKQRKMFQQVREFAIKGSLSRTSKMINYILSYGIFTANEKKKLQSISFQLQLLVSDYDNNTQILKTTKFK